jgi:GT2 family glycosyltransferase/glycosyltransferase involved in cell wall biosynthesis
VTQVAVPKTDEPLVSVVMVLYGGWETARRAIPDLVERTSPCFELVLVDNASPDDAAARMQEEVAGAQLILNETNRGFGVGSNQGAERAGGRYLCFLNSDALVQPGWLDPLVETLEGDRSVGAVVPLLLNPDGSIQEAGSVIDSIGHAHAVGSGGDADAFEYLFRREVDFGSAACMVVRGGVFAEVGGFDPGYAPAYFEDADLCFKFRKRGLRTIYEPRSRVVHVRFGSGSFESARNLMERNRHLFVEQWGERLAQRPRLLEVPQYPHQMLAARDADALERFLVIDDRVPFHDRGSGDPRMAQLLNELAGLWPSARITFLAADGQEAQRYAEPLLSRGIEVVCPPVDWNQWFEQRRFHYSVVIVSRSTNIARYEGYLWRDQPQALRVFDTEALTFRRLDRLAELLPPGSEANRVRAEAIQTREIEIRAVQEADVVLCVSDEEVEYIASVAPGKPTFVLPAIVDPIPNPGFDERRDLIFFGGFLAGPGSPNEDAVVYLVNEVLPAFWEQHPDVVLNIVGADATPAVRELAGPRVKVIGYVDDPSEWLLQARVHFNPMRFGAGVKLKLLDSMAAGLPFVTTSVGAEGLPLGDLRPSLVAEEPNELVRLASALYTDSQTWERSRAGLLQVAATHFDRASFQRTLIEAMSHLGVAPPPGLSPAAPDLALPRTLAAPNLERHAGA